MVRQSDGNEAKSDENNDKEYSGDENKAKMVRQSDGNEANSDKNGVSSQIEETHHPKYLGSGIKYRDVKTLRGQGCGGGRGRGRGKGMGCWQR